MKLTALTDATVYRMHVPRWAVAPTSDKLEVFDPGKALPQSQASWS